MAKDEREHKSSPAAALRAAFPDNFFENHLIRDYLTHGFGGVADYFVLARTTGELMEALKIAAGYQVPYAVIGQGTGTVVSEVGYPGLIILNRTETITFAEPGSQVVVDSGVRNEQLLNLAAS